MAKAIAMKIPKVDVAVVLIKNAERILAVHNPRWGAFTFPMTKRRTWKDPEISAGIRHEEWGVAATRAAAEVLGITFAPGSIPTPVTELRNFKQSDFDGKWKLYNLHVFQLTLADDAHLAQVVNAEWLPPDDFKKRQPISPTARYVIDHLLLEGLLP